MGRVIMSGIVPPLTAPVHIDPVLNNNSWETISKISQAGLAAQYWNVGDTKDIVINGTVGDTTLTNLTVHRQDQRHPGGPGRRQLRKRYQHHRSLYHEHVTHKQRRVE